MKPSVEVEFYYGFSVKEMFPEPSRIDIDKLNALRREVYDNADCGIAMSKDNYYLIVSDDILEFDEDDTCLVLGKEIKPDPEWDKKLKKACKLLGIDFKDPSFILFSDVIY